MITKCKSSTGHEVYSDASQAQCEKWRESNQTLVNGLQLLWRATAALTVSLVVKPRTLRSVILLISWPLEIPMRRQLDAVRKKVWTKVEWSRLSFANVISPNVWSILRQRCEITEMKFFKAALLTALHLAAYSSAAWPLEFSAHANDRKKTLTAILVTGKIVDGDVDRLSAYLRRSFIKKTVAVYLASSGGSLYEGMRLGRFFRQNRIRTVVEGGRDCASACALAFLGGTDHNGRPWRSSSTDSRLGFHAFRGISAAAVDENEVQHTVADILRYGKAVDAPIELLIAGFSTPSHDIFWVSQEDICALGIRLWSNETNRFVCNN